MSQRLTGTVSRVLLYFILLHFITPATQRRPPIRDAHQVHPWGGFERSLVKKKLTKLLPTGTLGRSPTPRIAPSCTVMKWCWYFASLDSSGALFILHRYGVLLFGHNTGTKNDGRDFNLVDQIRCFVADVRYRTAMVGKRGKEAYGTKPGNVSIIDGDISSSNRVRYCVLGHCYWGLVWAQNGTSWLNNKFRLGVWAMLERGKVITILHAPGWMSMGEWVYLLLRTAEFVRVMQMRWYV